MENEMNKKFAENFFYEKNLYKVLKYVAYAFLGFGIFSYIVIWSGVEIGTPFLVVGIVLIWFVHTKTVSGKDYLLHAELIVDEEIDVLQKQLSDKEKTNGSVITSKQFLFSPDFSVKKAGKNTLVSNCAQIVAMYCNDKVNRFHVFITTFDFLNGTKEELDLSGYLSDLSLSKEEMRYTQFGCDQKQLKISAKYKDQEIIFALNDDYPTNKLIDDYFVNRRL